MKTITELLENKSPENITELKDIEKTFKEYERAKVEFMFTHTRRILIFFAIQIILFALIVIKYL